ncbi:hypothetical protein EKD04_009715 [Chloroflexales bacterium ZM16-3]|nr:hypothetical protein [Chloroflexales bacterium ZM16-3]
MSIPRTPEELLAAIAAMDPEAAGLATEVLNRRRAADGDVAGWVDQIEKARQSLLGSFGKTRLAAIARAELGTPHPPRR